MNIVGNLPKKSDPGVCHDSKRLIYGFILSSLLIFSQAVWAQSLADKIARDLPAKPSQSELIKYLLKSAPKGVDVEPEQVLIPKQYIPILFGKKVAEFTTMAQLSNSFMNPEAGELGFMNTDEIEFMNDWPFNPLEGNAFLIGHMVAPANKMQIGYTTEEVPTKIAMQISGKTKSGATNVLFFIHPDHPEKYEEYVNGGAKNVPAKGWGIKWTHVGVLPSGPRSVLMLDLENPKGALVETKVNLHLTMDSGLRLIVPEKASRSVLATQLYADNASQKNQKDWGFRYLPEVMSVSLPYSHKSNVYRDPSLLFNQKDVDYVYAYSLFSPIKGKDIKESLAMKWLSPRPTKAKFEKLARKTFAMMARPFAYHVLVKGLYFEWHSANFLYALRDGELSDHIVVKDMEAIRADLMLMVRNGGDASSLQNYNDPFRMAKFTDAMGGNWESHTVEGKTYELQSPGFLAKQYLLHIRGKKESRSPKVQTTEDNTWGFSNIVDQARAFGIGALDLKLTNAEVEKWMDEEMAAAFEDVLRNELKISKADIPEVTVKQVQREIQLARGYSAVKWGVPEAIPADVEQVFEKMQTQGGLVRAVVQLRQHYDQAITRSDADPALQDLLRDEAERLTSLRRNTRKEWSNLSSPRAGYYFLFHEISRLIEVRDDSGWVGFFSMETDGSKGSAQFFENFKKIKGRYPKSTSKAKIKSCEDLLNSKDIFERGSFGERSVSIFFWEAGPQTLFAA